MTVIWGDAIESIPDLGEFDYVLTDPPYSVNAQYSWNKKGATEAMAMADAMQTGFLSAVLRAVRRKPEFAAWVFTDYKKVSFLYPVFSAMNLDKQACIVWDKVNPFVNATYHKRHEFIAFASNYDLGHANYYGQDIIACKKIHGNSKNHVYAKPPELVKMLCGSCRPGRVLDPFCGGGGLLKGAQELGWEVVGIDAVKEFSQKTEEILK